MTADEWQKQFEELWKQAFDPENLKVRIHYTHKGHRQVLVNHTGTITEKSDNSVTPEIVVREYKNNEHGFKNFKPYKVEYHCVWKQYENKLWNMYFPMAKYEYEDGTQHTVYQEAPKEFLTGATNE